MSEIDAMKGIESNFDKLDVEAQKRVLDWAYSRYVQTQPPAVKAGHPASPPKHAEAEKTSSGSRSTKKSKRSKMTLKLIKDLNLVPSGKQSGKDFAQEKAPSNAKQKCVVAIYYVREIVGLSVISADHVFTFFKASGWPIPSDMLNTLQQAGTAGWLDTSDAQDMKLTHIGENLVEHDLPKPAK